MIKKKCKPANKKMFFCKFIRFGKAVGETKPCSEMVALAWQQKDYTTWTNGEYTTLVNGATRQVYCAFDYYSSYVNVWTLIESSDLLFGRYSYNGVGRKPFLQDYPQNNYDVASFKDQLYRLSYDEMYQLTQKSEYTLSTCNFIMPSQLWTDHLMFSVKSTQVFDFFEEYTQQCINQR